MREGGGAYSFSLISLLASGFFFSIKRNAFLEYISPSGSFPWHLVGFSYNIEGVRILT